MQEKTERKLAKMIRPINNKVNICSLILFLLIGFNASAQSFDSLRVEYNFTIRIDSDSVLLMKKQDKFEAKAYITSQNKICLNSNLYDATHYNGNGICYELEGFKEGKFVPYGELGNPYDTDVNYSGDLYSELSKSLFYDFNPFAYHSPVANRVYRFRVFFRLNDSIINQSKWKYVYVIRKKNQIHEIEDMRKLVRTYQFKSQKADPLQFDSYLEKAQFYFENKDYEKARDYSLKVLELDSLNGEAYLLIGSAYVGFANSTDDKYYPEEMIYCLAVDKFQKAMEVDPNVKERAEMLIKLYSRYFPSGEVGWKEIKKGDRYKVRYWINEETTVRFAN